MKSQEFDVAIIPNYLQLNDKTLQIYYNLLGESLKK